MSKKESPRLVLLPTFPTAAVVVAATTAGAAAVVAALTAGGGAASWAAVATAAATTAIVTALVWPRVATDVLGLHGTSFPSPADGGDMPLLGRVPQLVTAARGKTLVHTYLDWQRRVGWGVNHQFYTLGRRAVVIVDPDDIRAVAMRLNAPRDQRKLRFFGTPLSADMLFVVPDPRHDNARRLVHPFLSGTPTTETVLRVVNETLWGVPSRSVGSDGARSGGGAAPPARWAAHLEALADSGESVDIDDLATSFTVHMIYALLYSETPSLSELADEKDRLIRLIADTTALVGLPAPELLGRARMTSLRKAGDKFFIELSAVPPPGGLRTSLVRRPRNRHGTCSTSCWPTWTRGRPGRTKATAAGWQRICCFTFWPVMTRRYVALGALAAPPYCPEVALGHALACRSVGESDADVECGAAHARTRVRLCRPVTAIFVTPAGSLHCVDHARPARQSRCGSSPGSGAGRRHAPRRPTHHRCAPGSHALRRRSMEGVPAPLPTRSQWQHPQAASRPAAPVQWRRHPRGHGSPPAHHSQPPQPHRVRVAVGV